MIRGSIKYKIGRHISRSSADCRPAIGRSSADCPNPKSVLMEKNYNKVHVVIIMPPTLKKLMGHIAFGACVGGCVRACITLFVPTVTFKPLKLES